MVVVTLACDTGAAACQNLIQSMTWQSRGASFLFNWINSPKAINPTAGYIVGVNFFLSISLL